MKNIGLILSVILIVSYFAFDIEGLSADNSSEILPRMLYMFRHGNIIHLAMNIYALLTLIFLCNINILQFVISLVISILLPDFILSSTPIVGISTAIYALTGMVIMHSRRWKYLFLCNMAIIGFAGILPGISFLAHLYCFVAGVFVGLLTAPMYGTDDR